jgi:hypothetical protein
MLANLSVETNGRALPALLATLAADLRVCWRPFLTFSALKDCSASKLKTENLEWVVKKKCQCRYG